MIYELIKQQLKSVQISVPQRILCLEEVL